MDNEYDEITAYHYLKYRPPLHELILAKGLKADPTYVEGLDIGCGTGQSSIAFL